MKNFTLVITILFTLFTQNARAMFQPLAENRIDSRRWHTKYFGKTNFNSGDMIVSLDSAEQALFVPDMQTALAPQVNTQNVYRLTISSLENPSLAVSYELVQRRDLSADHIGFISKNSSLSNITFEIQGRIGNSLRVDYKKSSNNTSSTGSFEISPMMELMNK